MQKLNLQQLPSIFKEVVTASYDSTLNKLTLTTVKGDDLVIELSPKDNFLLDVTYSDTTHKLTVKYLDNTTNELDLSGLIDVYTGIDGDDIKVEISNDNKITATIKDNAVTRAMLAKAVTDELDELRADIDTNKTNIQTNETDIKGIKTTITALKSVDSSSQGDVPILPLVDSATQTWQRIDVSSTTDGSDYADNLPAGYAFTSPQHMYLNKKFNRIKVNVVIPGWVRIGICRGTPTNAYDGVARGFYKAQSRYDATDVYPVSLLPEKNGNDTTADGQSHTMLKKWLVVRYIATTGLHEFDFPDEIISSPFEFLFMECRTGVSGYAMNRDDADLTVKGLTVPKGTVPNAQAWDTRYVDETYFGNGKYAISRNMLDASACISYSSLTNAGVMYSHWDSLTATGENDRISNSFGARTSVGQGWLNIGAYERGASGNTYLDPIIENVVKSSTDITMSATINNAIYGFGPKYELQQKLAEKKKRIYAIELIITRIGDLTVYLFSSNDPATCRVVKQWTLRTRAIGRQLIHLPEEVVLQEGEWIGVSGVTEALRYHTPSYADCTTSEKFNKGYVDTAQFAYGRPLADNWTCKGDDPTGVQDLMPYSSAAEEYSTHEFISWRNVEYTADAQQPYDFTGATLAVDSNNYLNISLVCRSGERSKIEDLNVSITGDSISTYKDVISRADDFNGITNAAGNNATFYPNSGSGLTNSVDGTWWGVLIKETRARLIKNDAWSGSQVGGTESTTSSTACASTIRTRMLQGTIAPYTANTGSGYAHPYGLPEVIFCMIGTNDLSSGRAAGAFSNTQVNDMSTIIGAFQTMVGKHKLYYPGAKCVYFMIPRGSIYPYPFTNATTGFSIAQMADAFEYVAKAMGAYFVPLSYFEQLNRPENGSTIQWTPTSGHVHPRESNSHWGTTDKLHPSINGHQMIAHALTRFINGHF